MSEVILSVAFLNLRDVFCRKTIKTANQTNIIYMILKDFNTQMHKVT